MMRSLALTFLNIWYMFSRYPWSRYQLCLSFSSSSKGTANELEMSSLSFVDHDPSRSPTTLFWFPIFPIRLKWSTTERRTRGWTITLEGTRGPVAVVATSSLEDVSVATPPDIAAAASGVGLRPFWTSQSSLVSLHQFFNFSCSNKDNIY